MIEWIISSSVLILVVTTLRFLLKGKLSLRLQYALWLLVLVRLLVPVSFASSSLSIGNLTQAAADTSVLEALETIGRVDIPKQSFQSAYDQVVQNYEEQGIDVSSLQGSALEALDYEAYSLMKGPELGELLRTAAFVIWIAGIIGVLLSALVSNVHFSIRLKRSRRQTGQDCSRLPVYLSEIIETPCLFGLFCPAIYVTPEVMADETAMRHVLAHETTHYRHGDHIWAVLRCVCLALHWYNPLVWLAAVLSRRDGELACDEGAIKHIGEKERTDYGRTLISLTCMQKSALLNTATTMTGSKQSIKERITLIAKKPNMAVYTLIAVLLVSVLAVGCTFTAAEEDGPWNFSAGDVSEAKAVINYQYHALSAQDTQTLADAVSRLEKRDFTRMDAADGEFSLDYGVALFCGNTTYQIIQPLSAKESIQIECGGERWEIDDDGLDKLIDSLLSAYSKEPAETGEIFVGSEAESSNPALGSAIDYVKQRIQTFNEGWREIAPGNAVTEGKITALTSVATVAMENIRLDLYLLEYRLRLDGDVEQVLAGGMNYEEIDGEMWLTEWESTGQPYILHYSETQGGQIHWDTLCFTNTEEIDAIYHANQELETELGLDKYTMAAQELYKLHTGTGTGEAVALTQEDINRVNEAFTPYWEIEEGLLTTNPLCCLLTSTYDAPQNLDLENFLAYFPFSEEVTDPKEFDALKECDQFLFGADATLQSMPVPTHRISTDKVNEVLERYMGISLADLSETATSGGALLYLEEYDAFYNFTSDAAGVHFQCTGGTITGDTVTLYSDISILTLRKEGDRYLIQSHIARNPPLVY